MINLDREDQRVLSEIDSKPYRLYLLNDLLPKTSQAFVNQNTARQFESRLNRLNEAKIVYKVDVKEKTYYFSPKAEIE